MGKRDPRWRRILNISNVAGYATLNERHFFQDNQGFAGLCSHQISYTNYIRHLFLVILNSYFKTAYDKVNFVKICDALRNLLLCKDMWCVAILLKVTLLHGCFSRFLNCTNGTKSWKASHINIFFLLG